MTASRHCCLLLVLLTTPSSRAGEPTSGWRGNGTGLWTEGKPPLEWSRIARGALDGLRSTLNRPIGAKPGDAPRVDKGLLREWAVLGPFAVADSVRDFDKDVLGGEATAEPSVGQKVTGREWKAASVPPDDIMVFGTAELPWLDLAKVVGF